VLSAILQGQWVARRNFAGRISSWAARTMSTRPAAADAFAEGDPAIPREVRGDPNCKNVARATAAG
jgi:hypothetical protein